MLLVYQSALSKCSYLVTVDYQSIPLHEHTMWACVCVCLCVSVQVYKHIYRCTIHTGERKHEHKHAVGNSALSRCAQTAVQRVTMDSSGSSEVTSSSSLSPSHRGGSGGLSLPVTDECPSASLDALGETRDGRLEQVAPTSSGSRVLDNEPLHEPSSVLLWGEVTDHRGAAKAASSSTGQRLYHGTFVRTLTLFADFWVRELS